MKPDETGPRKPYAKPQLTRVTLRPEEAVLAACKNLSVGGPGQPTCDVAGGLLRPGVVTRQRARTHRNDWSDDTDGDGLRELGDASPPCPSVMCECSSRLRTAISRLIFRRA